MDQHEEYIKKLDARLLPLFHPNKMGCGGHDITHVLRMRAMKQEIAEIIPDFDHYEYRVAIPLHNIDRSPDLMNPFKLAAIGTHPGVEYWGARARRVEEVVRHQLEECPFRPIARERIVDAVLKHGRKSDESDDTPLLKALRLADKWDRFGVFGLTGSSAFRGAAYLPYDPEQPFGVSSTAESDMTTHYHDFFRILEWVQISHGIRTLIERHPDKLAFFLGFVRHWGEEVANAHDVPNTVEEDIKQALGLHYYEKWAT